MVWHAARLDDAKVNHPACRLTKILERARYPIEARDQHPLPLSGFNEEAKG